MKKIIAILLLSTLIMSFSACEIKNETQDPIAELQIEPQLAQMTAICELAVMDCYYHNVAKYFEEGVGLWPFVKDKRFWVEYSGVVRVGVDVSQLSVAVDDTLVTVTIPEAKILGVGVDENTLLADAFVIDPASAKITVDDTQKAVAEAQINMKNAAEADSALLSSARQRVQLLLEQYITNIGNLVGEQYTIKWVFADGSSQTTTTTQPPAETTADNAA